MVSNPHFDENGYLIYDGRVPDDVRLLDDRVEGAAITAGAYFIFASGYVGAFLKLAYLAYSIYSFISSLTNRPGGFGNGSVEQERGFGFDIQNTFEPNQPLAIIYGEHKIAPHYFYSKLSNFGNNNRLDLGLGIGEGPITSISGLKVNNVEFENLTGTNNYDFHDGSSNVVDSRLDVIAVTTDFNDLLPEAVSGTASGIVRGGVRDDAVELEVGILFPQGLFKTSETGIKHATVTLQFEYRTTGSSTWFPASGTSFQTSDQVDGETVAVDTAGIYELRDKHQGEIRKTLTIKRGLTADEYEIRITNLTADRDDFTGAQAVHLDFINEYIEEDFDVDNFAYLGMTLEATSTVQGSAPLITLIAKGRKVRVYTSATAYTEIWSDNPAWCLLDLITNPVYGLGFIYSHGDIDIASFLSVAQYLDQIDSNGVRRGKLDLVIGDVRPAIDWIGIITDSFGGIFIPADKVKIVCFRDEAATQSFTEATIIKDAFEIQRIAPSESTAVNRINVTFFNKEKDYARDVHQESISSEILTPADVISRDVELAGVTSPQSVEALARRMLKSLRTNVLASKFKADLSHVSSEVGDLITITHTLPGWTNKKFRIMKMSEEPNQVREIEVIEHNASVFDETSSNITPIIQTTLWNPLSTASPIEDLSVMVEYVTMGDGTIRTDLGIFWTLISGAAEYFNIDRFEIYSAVSSGSELPSGTSYNVNDFHSHFFISSSGTVISGSLFSPYQYEGFVRPPVNNYRIENIRPLDFYNVSVRTVTDNSVQEDFLLAPTAAAFVTTYSGQPTNTSSFTATSIDDDIQFDWSPVPTNQAPDLSGYEIRNENASFGNDDDGLVFRGTTTSYLLRDIDFRSQSFFIKSFNSTGIYAATVRSATYTNTAPIAITQLTPIISGPTYIVRYNQSVEADVIGYKIWASTTPGFTPSSSNVIAEIVGKDITTYRFQPERNGSTYDTWYTKVAPLDPLSNTLEDYNFSNQVSGTPVTDSEAVLLEQNSYNIIRDGSFRGLGQWSTVSGSSISSDKGHLQGTNSTLQQFLVTPSSTIGPDSDWFLALEVDAATPPNSDVTMRVTNSGSYKLEMVIPSGSIVTTGTRFTDAITFTSPIPSSLAVEITSSSTSQVNVDRAMLSPGSPNNQFLSSSFDILRGVSDAITETEIGNDAIAARHLQANSVAAENIIANTITADRYAELRQTLYFRFAGELDDSNPLTVTFHLPSELVEAADIIDVKLSYFRQPFRATTKSTTLAQSETATTTQNLLHQTHTHLLTAAANTNINGNVFQKSDGVWYRPAGTAGIAQIQVSAIQGHFHYWNITNRGSPSNSDAILRRNGIGGTVIGCANKDGQFTTTSNAHPDTGEFHQHVVVMLYNGFNGIPTDTPSQGRISLKDGTDVGTGVLLGYDATGTMAIVLTTAGPSPHAHNYTAPAHTHTQQFGIFEESNASTIAIRRSDNGSTFEGSSFTSSSSASRLDVDLDSDVFFSSGAGSGFKAIKIFSSGSNEGRTRIDGIIMVKCDINA